MASPAFEDVESMFADLTGRCPKFAETVARFESKPLRVATMCSGTESPLIALNFFAENLRAQYDVDLNVEHVFSCEIEPFKQAYIERNFAPPILFRDVRELVDDRAYTAYGSLVEVPTDVDLLIAGTSCVDYSALNKQGNKSIDGIGESGQTFRGMFNWVQKAKPALVILENVCNAPWAQVAEKFRRVGYKADYIRVDTKKYYIPHTRTRVYLLAVLSADVHVTDNWKALFKGAQRESTATLDSFLFDEDHPAVASWRKSHVPREPAVVDWSRCEGRHETARLQEGLGKQCPYYNWARRGPAPDYAWGEWLRNLSHRVLDLINIKHLRLARKGVDATRKTIVWNLSQNVDRMCSNVYGICPCLTPTMLAFITSRGGPLTGLEALMLQGIPVKRVLLTQETEAQMADLAGNAMTTTVVGAAILSALLVDPGAYLPRVLRRQPRPPRPPQVFAKGAPVPLATPVDLADATEGCTRELVEEATLSRKLCACEGPSTAGPALECARCGHTACVRCAGSPPHEYAPFAADRRNPGAFHGKLEAALPPAVALSGIGAAAAETRAPADWRTACATADGDYTLREVRRGRVWVARYERCEPGAVLEFVVGEGPPRWLARRRGSAPPLATAPLRPDSKGVLDVEWTLNRPEPAHLVVTLEPGGARLPSWLASMGIEERPPTFLPASYAVSHEPVEGVDVSGEYSLLRNCGGPNGALYARGGLFLFLDPGSTTEASADACVFARSHRRLKKNEHRDELLRLSPSFGLAVDLDRAGATSVPAVIPARKTPAAGAKLRPLVERGGTCEWFSDRLSATAPGPAALLHARIAAPEGLLRGWSCDVVEVDVPQQLRWLTRRVSVPPNLARWQVMAGRPSAADPTCAPPAPRLTWVRKMGERGERVVIQEDPLEAAAFEKLLKNRPPAIKVLRLKTSAGEAEVVFAMNPAALAHRALRALGAKDEPVTMRWRLAAEEASAEGGGAARTFALRSTVDELPAAQPPDWNPHVPLREDQLKSLAWMLRVESDDTPYEEVETEEAVVPTLGVRLEAQACRAVSVRGGLVADCVGYGKTALVIALMLSSRPGAADGSAKGTLIIVPGQLMKQWPGEIAKFTRAVGVLAIQNMRDLAAVTVRDVLAADAVIVPMTLLRKPAYYEHLAAFGESTPPPLCNNTKERHFEQEYETCARRARQRFEAMRGRGAEDVSAPSSPSDVRTSNKRLKGAALIRATKACGGEGIKYMQRAAKGRKRRQADFWGGLSASRFEDPELLRAPPLELFDWARVVIDEYTYMGTFERVFARRASAAARWCLSGTPMLRDFQDVRGVAELLGATLGSELPPLGKRTQVDDFQALSVVRSAAWVRRRDDAAEEFLARFARQNDAETCTVATTTRALRVNLPASARLCYMEHEQQVSKGGGNSASKAKSSREESLLKRAAHFPPGSLADTHAARVAEVEACRAELTRKTLNARRLSDLARARYPDVPDHFAQWASQVAAKRTGDDDAHATVRGVLQLATAEEAARLGADPLPAVEARLRLDDREAVVVEKFGQYRQKAIVEFVDGGERREIDFSKLERDRDYAVLEAGGAPMMKETSVELREAVHAARLCAKQLVALSRSLRFFAKVRAAVEGAERVECDLSGARIPTSAAALFVKCGHTVDASLVSQAEECPARGCACPCEADAIRPMEEVTRFFVDAADERGSAETDDKMRELVFILTTRVEPGERALVFAQYPEVLAQCQTALREAGIDSLAMHGSVSRQTKILENFQSEACGARALLLTTADETAAGANLTCANHVVFMHPHWFQTGEEVEAVETQAIGRVRRFGQTKPVTIWRLIAAKTIDDELSREARPNRDRGGDSAMKER